MFCKWNKSNAFEHDCKPATTNICVCVLADSFKRILSGLKTKAFHDENRTHQLTNYICDLSLSLVVEPSDVKIKSMDNPSMYSHGCVYAFHGWLDLCMNSLPKIYYALQFQTSSLKTSVFPCNDCVFMFIAESWLEWLFCVWKKKER